MDGMIPKQVCHPSDRPSQFRQDHNIGEKPLRQRALKQAEAARVLRVTQPRVSDLLRGRIHLFSTDALIDLLARVGVGVRLVVKSARSRQVA